jgi:hypothetical protein
VLTCITLGGNVLESRHENCRGLLQQIFQGLDHFGCVEAIDKAVIETPR